MPKPNIAAAADVFRMHSHVRVISSDKLPHEIAMHDIVRLPFY